MDDRPDLDALLDAALSNYCGQTAPAGMEARVLRRVQERRRAVRWPWFSIPSLAAACALAVAVAPRPELPALKPPRLVAPPPISVVQYRKSTPQRGRRAKQPQLTAQQRALLDLAVNYPEEASRMVREVPDELAVSELSMTPLSVTELDQ